MGWLWRNPAGKVQFYFVTDIRKGRLSNGGDYPPGAVFMAVYVPDMDWDGKS